MAWTIIAFIFACILSVISYFKEIKPDGRLATGTIIILTLFLVVIATGVTNIISQNVSTSDDKREIIDTVVNKTAKLKESLNNMSVADNLIQAEKIANKLQIDSLRMALENEKKDRRKDVLIDIPIIDIYPLPAQPNPVITRVGTSHAYLLKYFFKNDGGAAHDLESSYFFTQYANRTFLRPIHINKDKTNEGEDLHKAPFNILFENYVLIDNFRSVDTFFLVINVSFKDRIGKLYHSIPKIYRFTMDQLDKTIIGASSKEYDLIKSNFKKNELRNL